jgi:hypothetical protein
MIILYCYIAVGFAFYWFFQENNGFELLGLRLPEYSKRNLELAVFFMFSFWPVLLLLMLLVEQDR